MDKLIPIFCILSAINNLLPITSQNVKGITEQVDQQNMVISQSSVTIYNYGHNQTFTPTVNVLTKVQVYLKDRSAGGNIILTIRDEIQDIQVLSINQRMDSGTGWEVFSLAGGDELGYVLVPGNLHSIYLETSYYTEAPVPKWVRSGTNSYSGGTRRQNETVYEGDDFPFATWGYSTEEEEEEVPPSEENGDQQDQLPETGSETGDDQSQSQQQEPDKPIDAGEVEVDTTVEIPTLDYIVKNDEQMDAPIEDEVEISSEDILQIVGNAPADSKVLLFIGEIVYSTEVDSEGKWSIVVDPEDIKEGEFLVQAQTQIDDDMGSEKAVLFTLNRVADKETSKIKWPVPEYIEQTLWQKLTVGAFRIYSIIGLSVLLVVFISLWLFIVWRREKSEKGKTEKKTVPKKENDLLTENSSKAVQSKTEGEEKSFKEKLEELSKEKSK